MSREGTLNARFYTGLPPALALTSLREGKRSVLESKPPSPSWESRESRPGKERVHTVRKELRPGERRAFIPGTTAGLSQFP